MLKNCAQSVPENIENYRKISNSIEIRKALFPFIKKVAAFVPHAYSFQGKCLLSWTGSPACFIWRDFSLPSRS